MFNYLILMASALASGTEQATNNAAAVAEALTQVKAIRVQGSIEIDG